MISNLLTETQDVECETFAKLCAITQFKFQWQIEKLRLW